MWHCDATQQGWLVNKITLKSRELDKETLCLTIMELASTSESLVKDRFISRKTLPVISHQGQEDRTQIKPCLRQKSPGCCQTVKRRRLRDVLVRFALEGSWCLHYFPHVCPFRADSSHYLLRSSPPPASSHSPKAWRSGWRGTLKHVSVWAVRSSCAQCVTSPGCLPPSVPVTSGKDNRTPCSDVKRMDGWMDEHGACLLNCLTLLTFSCYLTDWISWAETALKLLQTGFTGMLNLKWVTSASQRAGLHASGSAPSVLSSPPAGGRTDAATSRFMCFHVSLVGSLLWLSLPLLLSPLSQRSFLYFIPLGRDPTRLVLVHPEWILCLPSLPSLWNKQDNQNHSSFWSAASYYAAMFQH